MVEGDEKERIIDDKSRLFVKTPSHAELRRRARENLEKAEQVLAESGNQLPKNKKEDRRTQNQEIEKNKNKDDKEE